MNWFGFYITGEKIIDDETSIGIYYLPLVYFTPVNAFEISYNKQVVGKEEDAFALSYYLGVFGSSSFGGMFFPELGMALRWRLSDSQVFRLRFLYFLPFIEWGYKLRENTELGVGFDGYPLAIKISLRRLF